MITYLQAAFEKVALEREFKDPISAILCDEYVEICRDFDATEIQDSWSWRNVYIARELAKTLIDEQGVLKKRSLSKAIQILEENLYSLGHERYNDAARQNHLLKVLRLFYEEKEYLQAFKKITKPEEHQGAQRLIRETLFLPDNQPITDMHAKQAVLSALLTSLRQNVGSCFATAPAILIHQEQPLQFLADMTLLLNSGRLTRILNGVEYAAPLSASWGIGDLFKPFNFARVDLDTLAYSPGLQAAFHAAGLIQTNDRKEKYQQCLNLLKRFKIRDDPFLFMSADLLLKQALLMHFNLTEEDVKHFRERPVEGVMQELIVQTALPSKGKSHACRLYLKAYEDAKEAFKVLTDNALLKSWEFTLASLAETKADFAKWNLYLSLGVQPEDANGIGESLKQKLQERIEEINRELEEYQSKYDHLYAQLKYIEGRFRRASSESELSWIRADYAIRKQEINRILNERDEIHERGQRLTRLFPFLINFYGEKIRDYFQEVYDAEMHDVSANPYDDSPAGFRLLYKHGRSNTALWTMIYTPSEYIRHLTSFFMSTEVELSQLTEVEGLEKDISDLITTIITTIKRPEFLESSFYRLARAYNEPLVPNPMENLDRIKRKPWSYISGGTMGTLVSCYWQTHQPKESTRWIEDENELLAFLLDTMRELPFNVQKIYQKDPNRSMLVFSPTHAFLCKPGWRSFREGWESEVYTYTWIRDHWMLAQHQFLEAQLLDPRMMDNLIEQLLHFVPRNFRAIIKHALNDFSFPLRPAEFRAQVMKILSYERWVGKRHLDLIGEEIDSILYRSLPLFPEHQLKERLERVFQEIDPRLNQQVLELFDEDAFGRYRIMSAEDLRNIAQGLLILTLDRTRTPLFYQQAILAAMRKLGFAYPHPILFADTNWVKNVFGFTVNPGNDRLEFWRFDENAVIGRPISIWKQYLDGTNRQEWGVYISPNDYGQF